jgi:hypothetical protein
MLTPRQHSTTRRQLVLASLAALATSACVRVAERSAPPSTPTSRPELDGWTAQARTMLSDALETLRTFDVFAAYRVSITPESRLRFASELTWDPPTDAAWDSATHIARSLHGRADQLFQAVTTAQIDKSMWREQRSLADAIYGLRVVGDALVAYRDRIDTLPPGDASGALTLLDMAWTQWEGTAVRFGISRSKPIACNA